MAIALLAQALLIESRKILQSETDPNITIRNAGELFTDDMRDMLLTAEDTDDSILDEGVMWDRSLPSGGWEL